MEEDKLLTELINVKGQKAWASIARELNNKIHNRLPIRQGKQCRERWSNHLNPGLKKGSWSDKEDIFLLKSQRDIGNRWSEIARGLPGRTENQVKNRWKSLIFKAEKEFPIGVDIVSMLIAEKGGMVVEVFNQDNMKVISPVVKSEGMTPRDFGFGKYADNV